MNLHYGLFPSVARLPVVKMAKGAMPESAARCGSLNEAPNFRRRGFAIFISF